MCKQCDREPVQDADADHPPQVRAGAIDRARQRGVEFGPDRRAPGEAHEQFGQLAPTGDHERREDADDDHFGHLAGDGQRIGVANHHTGRRGVEHPVDAPIQFQITRRFAAALLSAGRSATAECNESDNDDACRLRSHATAPSTATVPNMPIKVTITMAAPRGIHLAKDWTNGAAMTAAVVAAPSNTKTCAARSTRSTPANVATTKQPSRAKPRADTTTVYS